MPLSYFTKLIVPELADMADAAPAGDRGGFRGGFGDRGRQVNPILCIFYINPSCDHFVIRIFLLIVFLQGRQGSRRQGQGPWRPRQGTWQGQGGEGENR